MKLLGLLLQLFTMLFDLLLIAAIIIVGYFSNWFVAFIFFCLVTWVQEDIGGWFYAWKPKNIKKFFKNWREL